MLGTALLGEPGNGGTGSATSPGVADRGAAFPGRKGPQVPHGAAAGAAAAGAGAVRAKSSGSRRQRGTCRAELQDTGFRPGPDSRQPPRCSLSSGPAAAASAAPVRAAPAPSAPIRHHPRAGLGRGCRSGAAGAARGRAGSVRGPAARPGPAEPCVFLPQVRPWPSPRTTPRTTSVSGALTGPGPGPARGWQQRLPGGLWRDKVVLHRDQMGGFEGVG